MTTVQHIMCSSVVAVVIGSALGKCAGDDLGDLAQSVRWRHVTLQATARDDLIVDLPHDASKLRFAEFIYGTPESPRVAVAVAQEPSGDFLLYVDADRDRGLSDRDRVEGSGALRSLALQAQHVEDNVVSEYPRDVLFRWQAGDSHVSIATATTLQHTVDLGDADGKKVVVSRLIDGNANGLFADTKDLLQVDVNADGAFDPFLETFPFRPVVKLGGRRFFVKADQFGSRLNFDSASATGRIRVIAKARSESDRISDLIVTLVGEDGSVFSMSGNGSETELPVGRYAASVLFVVIAPQGTDTPWEFTFSRNDPVRDQDWLTVTEGVAVKFDPIGELVMDAVVERSRRGGGANLNVQPRLFTGSGLLINLCQIAGSAACSGPNCSVSLVDAAGASVGHASSGFA